jgi:hypothetical protein
VRPGTPSAAPLALGADVVLDVQRTPAARLAPNRSQGGDALMVDDSVASVTVERTVSVGDASETVAVRWLGVPPSAAELATALATLLDAELDPRAAGGPVAVLKPMPEDDPPVLDRIPDDWHMG